MTGPSARASPGGGAAVVGDLALARGLWLLLLAQVLTTLPNSATGIFLPWMAADLNADVSLVGGLRSLGGVAALACGVLAAPLIDRFARAHTIAAGLVALSIASLLAAYGSLASLGLFFALAAAASAVCQPALLSAAADGRDPTTGARAAAMLSGWAALSPMLAGPLLGGPAALWGWRGDFVALAAAFVLLAGLTAAALKHRPPTGVVRPGYRAAFGLVAAAPGAVPLLVGSTLRWALQMAWLTYLAGFLAAAFGAPAGVAALTWTLGGSAFFVANLAVGRLIRAGGGAGWRTPERLLPPLLATATLLTPLSLIAPTLPLAVLGAALAAGVHGGAVAAIISLLVGRFAPIRGGVLGLNAAGANLGLFAGAALGGVALGTGAYPGLALLLALLGVASVGATAWAVRRLQSPAESALSSSNPA